MRSEPRGPDLLEAPPDGLLVRGPSPDAARRLACAAFLAGMGLYLATIVALRFGAVPWLRWGDPAVWVALVAGPFCAFAMCAVTLRGHAAAGDAALGAEGVTLDKEPSSGHRVVIAWSEVLGYRDDAAGFVRLVLAQDHGTYSAIPTPTEQDRVAVLAFLDARGLKRVG